MKVYGLAGASAVLALLLAGCGGRDEDRAPTPAPTASEVLAQPPAIPVMGPEVPVLALGDSLFAGYGLEDGESYPARLEAALRARGINAKVTNAGVSGDTTAGGLQRLTFTLDSMAKPPVLAVISLGGNDMLRGLPPEQTRHNLDAILTELDKRGIRAVLMGMLAPPNLGPDYRAEFDPIFPTLAKQHDAVLVPFFLQPVMDRPDLVQKDRIHPTAQGIDAIVAATVDTVAGAVPKPAEGPAIDATGAATAAATAAAPSPR